MTEKPITKRWPGHHCTRSKVWIPGNKPGSYSTVAIETRLDKPVAELVLQLLVKGQYLDSELVQRCKTLADDIRAAKWPKKEGKR